MPTFSPGRSSSGARRPAATFCSCICSAWSPSPARCAKGTSFRVWSLGEAADAEPELIRRFFDGIERYAPQLVSWNGGGFDLPVLNHRSLIHGVAAPRYWDWGDDDRDFRYNNYLSRYHTRHLDLMDVLASFQPRAGAGLHAMARLCGFPGKLGIRRCARSTRRTRPGGSTTSAVIAKPMCSIPTCCICAFSSLRGTFSAGQYAAEISLAREKIAAAKEPHWREFIAAWDAGRGLTRRYARSSGTAAKRPPSGSADGTPHQRSSTVA